ncbi:MAG: ERF family protein [Desulfocucumaceae bacterium]
MNKSESIANIAKSLAQFQEEVKNPANTAINPHFKSKYAPLHEILNEIRPILAKNGLSVFQAPSGDGEKIIITTLLMHESGEWIEACPLILKADKATAQGAGSAITYGRRYALSAVLGISSEDDDDGNVAEKSQKKQEQARQESPKQQTQTPPQAAPEPPKQQPVNWSSFWAGCKKLGYTQEQVHEIAGEASISHYVREQATKLYQRLEYMKQEAKESA